VTNISSIFRTRTKFNYIKTNTQKKGGMTQMTFDCPWKLEGKDMDVN